jgi:thioredoxin-like negative regulator of GroEL
VTADPAGGADTLRDLADGRRQIMEGGEAQRSAALHDYITVLTTHSRDKIAELTAERDAARARINEALGLLGEADDAWVVLAVRRALTGDPS